MNIKNKIRNALNIRKQRAILPPGPMPRIGSSIVFLHLRIKLKYHLTHEQWDWFLSKGWRSVDMRKERRKYVCVPDKILIKIMTAEVVRRDDLHERLLNVKVSTLEKALKLELMNQQ